MADRDEAGLRSTKKDRTRADILANAISLFRSNGIRGARSNQIARASGVSPATLFNYFPTKAAIAEAWVRGEIEQAFARIGGGPADPAIRSILRSACRDLAALMCQDRSGRLEAWAETGRAPRASLGMRHPLVVALVREQKRERVRADIPTVALAGMLMDAIESGLIAGLRSEAAEPELARTLQARIDLILDGARKRNERVAPSSLSARSRQASAPGSSGADSRQPPPGSRATPR
jgi:AcrR family transcriptional regulator